MYLVSASMLHRTQALLNSQPSSSDAHVSTSPDTSVHSNKQCLLSIKTTWVIDSRAFDNMIGMLKVFSIMSYLHPNSSMTLTDGSSTKAFGIIKAHSPSNVSCDSSLYNPHFPMSLLSVSKLEKLLNYFVTFLPSYYVIQDLRQRMNRRGREASGLYCLNKESTNSACYHYVYALQWGCHLGHPYLDKLKALIPILTSMFDCFV